MPKKLKTIEEWIDEKRQSREDMQKEREKKIAALKRKIGIK